MPTAARLALLSVALSTSLASAQPAQVEARAPLPKAFDVQLDPTPFFLEGWLVAPFKAVPGLFLAPWVGSSFSVAPQAFTVDEVAITRKLVGFTAALQVGCKFCL